jgi:thymidylate kinase
MEHFLTKKQITDNKIIGKLKCSTKEFIINETVFHLYTYTIKKKFRENEDDIYAKNPDLLKYLPRACSIIVSDTIIDIMEGPTKFSGATPIDEDPEDEEDNIVSSIFDQRIVNKWAKDCVLVVTDTEKANGKFAILKICNDVLVFGSKNSHVIIPLNNLDYFYTLENTTEIVQSIFEDIKKNIDILKSEVMLSYFTNGYSLVGELCDGQHFTDGDNTISYFGFFKNGQSVNTLDLLQSVGLKTVSSTIVFTQESNPDELNNVYLNSRCKNNEGSVLYFRNVETNDTILVKSKSAIYIVKRFLREILSKKGKGYKAVEQLRKRFIDAKGYHNLNTEASIRLTNLLFNFTFWMIQQQFPGTVLGCQPVRSVRGVLNNGFNNYWKKFIVDEPTLTPDDFGEFDESEYVSNTQLYPKRGYDNPATVVFLQGLQGSGKSTIANEICKVLPDTIYLEQDQFYSDTDACQGALYHAISNDNGPKNIIISRCNVEESQYQWYLKICYSLPTRIIFIAPDKIDTIYLAVSLSGIIKRSQDTDKLLVGRIEYPIEQVIEFTTANYYKFVPHSKAYRVNFNNSCESIVVPENKELLKDFILENHNTLNDLRVPINEIVTDIINIINNISFDHIITNPTPVYIGMAVSKEDKLLLDDFVNKIVPNGILYNHHCTQLFLGGKKPVPNDPMLVIPGQKVDSRTECLVVRKSDNASAFKIALDNISLTHTPHITAKLPESVKPSESNSFVGLTDDTVNIYQCDIYFQLIGFYV